MEWMENKKYYSNCIFFFFSKCTCRYHQRCNAHWASFCPSKIELYDLQKMHICEKERKKKRKLQSSQHLVQQCASLRVSSSWMQFSSSFRRYEIVSVECNFHPIYSFPVYIECTFLNHIIRLYNRMLHRLVIYNQYFPVRGFYYLNLISRFFFQRIMQNSNPFFSPNSDFSQSNLRRIFRFSRLTAPTHLFYSSFHFSNPTPFFTGFRD